MTKLVLDPLCVLSAWEQMGGNAFSSDDKHLGDPDAFTLDLSSWEARLKPLSVPSTSQLDTNIFASLFNPSELCFPFLPNCSMQPVGSSFFPEGPQVVPFCCPSISAGSLDNQTNFPQICSGLQDCLALDDTAQGSHMDEDVHMSLHFSDGETTTHAPSPTSSEPGIVPDIGASGCSPRKAQQGQQPNGSTATSGLLPQGCAPSADAPAAALPPSPPHAPLLHSHLAVPAVSLCSPFFVPVAQPHPVPAAAAAAAAPISCSGSTPGCCHQCHQQEGIEAQHQSLVPALSAAALALQQPQQPVPPIGATAAAAERQQGAVQPQQLSRAHASPAAVAQQQCHQQQQQLPPSGPSAHIHHNSNNTATATATNNHQHVRTRAECLERYREKKARRLYTKKIRYQLRKINADKRPRIKGRFVKKEELAEFLAAQRGASGAAAARDEADDPYFGDGGMDTDEE